jgi:hypothetical protein
MKKLILTTCLTALSFCASAQFIDGNSLFRDMNSTVLSENMFALGYITGVVDAHDGEKFCTPDNASAGQLRDVVKALLEVRPEYRHYSADTLVTAAMVIAFPCKKGSGV